MGSMSVGANDVRDVASPFNRSVMVSYDNCISNANDVLTGVPQGSILGPLLLITFLNDVTDVISSAKIIMLTTLCCR